MNVRMNLQFEHQSMRKQAVRERHRSDMNNMRNMSPYLQAHYLPVQMMHPQQIGSVSQIKNIE
jgi:hypothetical protein